MQNWNLVSFLVAPMSLSLYIHKLTPKVESQLKTHQLVDNICVYADSQKTHTVALLVPIRDQLEKFAAKEINSDFQSMSFEQLCEDDNLEKVKYRVYKLKYISKYFSAFLIWTSLYVNFHPRQLWKHCLIMVESMVWRNSRFPQK